MYREEILVIRLVHVYECRYSLILFVLLTKLMTISYPWETHAVRETTQSSTEDEMVSISLLNLSYWTIMIHENSGTPYSCVAHNLACN